MSYKTLITHIVQDDGLPRRLEAAAAVARRFEADVIGVGAQAPWPFADEREGGGAALRSLAEGVRADLKGCEAAFLSLRGLFPGAVSWAADVAFPDRAMARRAAGADLVLAWRPGPGADLSVYADPASLAIECGTPVLLMPDTADAPGGDRVVVAWKNTREARRAVSESLPVLKRATDVVLFSICEDADPEAVRVEQAQVLLRLQRHGVKAAGEIERGSGQDAGELLLGRARALGGDLIVAGAFGHSRFREWVLGGATRRLLAQASLALLLCH